MLKFLLQQYLPEPEMMQITANNIDNDDSILPRVDPVPQTKYRKVQQRRKRLGLILAITLAAHNFPEAISCCNLFFRKYKIWLYNRL